MNNKEEIYPPKYKKYLIWPIKYIKHYKSTEYMKSTELSINMIGNEKQRVFVQLLEEKFGTFALTRYIN